MFNFGEDYMKQFYDNWQQAFGGQLEKMVNDQEFISQMAKAIAATMTGKSMASKTMNEAMSMMNLPTKDDIVLIQQKLTDIEERLIDHSEFVEDSVEECRAELKKLQDRIQVLEKSCVEKKPASAPRVKTVGKKPVKASPVKPAKKSEQVSKKSKA